jgi:hypothetical protein
MGKRVLKVFFYKIQNIMIIVIVIYQVNLDTILIFLMEIQQQVDCGVIIFNLLKLQQMVEISEDQWWETILVGQRL